MIAGRLHRVCDCDPLKETCERIPVLKRRLLTAEFARCLVRVDESSTAPRNIAEEIIEGLKEAKASLSAGDKP